MEQIDLGAAVHLSLNGFGDQALGLIIRPQGDDRVANRCDVLFDAVGKRSDEAILGCFRPPTKLAAPVLLDHLLKVVDQRSRDDEVRKLLSIAAMSTAYDLDRLSRASLIGLAMFRAEDVRACIL